MINQHQKKFAETIEKERPVLGKRPDWLKVRLPTGQNYKEVHELMRKSKPRTAADAMETYLITVREDTSIEKAINLMAENHLKRLPVVDENGVYKGMVNRDAVLRAGVKFIDNGKS